MSADLLRRAARELREVVAGLDSEQRASWANMCRTWFADGPPVGAFAGTLSPPVALALAAWLDDEASATPVGADDWPSVAVARAILREES